MVVTCYFHHHVAQGRRQEGLLNIMLEGAYNGEFMNLFRLFRGAVFTTPVFVETTYIIFTISYLADQPTTCHGLPPYPKHLCNFKSFQCMSSIWDIRQQNRTPLTLPKIGKKAMSQLKYVYQGLTKAVSLPWQLC